ncbi:cell wall hydrolase [Aureimonas sp. ME7]|uniref:cell wall hydrolase n=1 Tax=Aureimonas sp. ME7 TaxID=2744252 RepID=UPI001FCEEAF3|nr:cell wall hydrolase [Aureimonas sp. ME7]
MSPNQFFLLASAGALLLVGGCAKVQPRMSSQECLARAMYFESNRSSEAGMLAVGTVVMNRLESGRYPQSVCGVVGQKNQFAPGVLSKPMGKGRELASQTAGRVLKGARHPEVQKAMFFHTAGYSFPYTNMHYLTIQGGNSFYEKRKNATSTQAMVAERQRSEKEGRLPFNPAARNMPTEVAVRTPEPAIMRAPVRQSRIAREVARGAGAVSAPPLEAMSIEDLIQQNGG